MRRNSAAQGEALVQLRMRYSVFRGWPSPLTQLSHPPSFTVRVLLRLMPRPLSQNKRYPYTAKGWHVLFVKLHYGSPSWWRCWFRDVTTDSKLALMSALGQQPVSFTIGADQSSFRLCKPVCSEIRAERKLDHGVLAIGHGSTIVADLDIPTSCSSKKVPRVTSRLPFFASSKKKK